MKSAQQTLTELSHDLNAQICAQVCGRDVTRAQLAAWFQRVEDKTNWKNPIDATVTVADDFDLIGIYTAIEFFTGSKASACHFSGRNTYRFEARGYYLTCGA